MGAFEVLHRERVTGSLAMFDRMIFKGRLTALYKENGAKCFLWTQGVALKDFTPYAKWTTARIADTVRGVAEAVGRPVISFDHVKTRHYAQRKDDLARSIAERDGITEGIICVISAVESCMSLQVRKSFKSKTIQMYRRERKCLHHYLYLVDPEFGFMHVRIQGWIPYDCQIYINGREWLTRRLDETGINYVRYDNALVKVANLEAACQLCERFAHRAWPQVLNAFARMVNPVMPIVRAAGYGGYYWVLDQAEIATDVMFSTRQKLTEIWPDLVRHAALNMGSEDVLGFLGRKLHPSLAAEVVTDTKRRPEGWRVRHRMGANWVKMYDKASVLRVETVINNPRKAHRFARTCARWHLRFTGSPSARLGPGRRRKGARRQCSSRWLRRPAWDRGWRSDRPGAWRAAGATRSRLGRVPARGTDPTPACYASW
jgi:hypothetical protein